MRKSEDTLREYEAAEASSDWSMDWLQVTDRKQKELAADFLASKGLPTDASHVNKLVHTLRCHVHKEPFLHVGLPQQVPINRARRGNLTKGEVAPSVSLCPLLASQCQEVDVGQPTQFPSDICKKPYTVIVAGSYS